MRIHAPKIRPESLLNPEKIAKMLPVEPDRPPCIVRLNSDITTMVIWCKLFGFMTTVWRQQFLGQILNEIFATFLLEWYSFTDKIVWYLIPIYTWRMVTKVRNAEIPGRCFDLALFENCLPDFPLFLNGKPELWCHQYQNGKQK